MNAFTPGPWHSALVSQKTWHVGVYDSSGAQVALVNVASALHGPRRDADARLIAAAPELLEALQAVVRVADRATDEFDLARAAIRKATGQTS